METQFSEDGCYLAWTSYAPGETKLSIRSVDPNRTNIIFDLQDVTVGYSFRFLPGGTNLIVCRQDESQWAIQVWDFLEDALISSIPVDGSHTAFSTSQPWAANFGTDLTDRKVDLWDWQKQVLLAELPSPLAPLGYESSWTSDGNRLAIATANGQIQVWDIPRLRRQLAELGLDWEDE